MGRKHARSPSTPREFLTPETTNQVTEPLSTAQVRPLRSQACSVLCHEENFQPPRVQNDPESASNRCGARTDTEVLRRLIERSLHIVGCSPLAMPRYMCLAPSALEPLVCSTVIYLWLGKVQNLRLRNARLVRLLPSAGRRESAGWDAGDAARGD